MSDINLLPEEMRKQDERELRRNRREPHRHEIELTQPLKETPPLVVPKPPQKHHAVSWKDRLLFWKSKHRPSLTDKSDESPAVVAHRDIPPVAPSSSVAHRAVSPDASVKQRSPHRWFAWWQALWPGRRDSLPPAHPEKVVHDQTKNVKSGGTSPAPTLSLRFPAESVPPPRPPAASERAHVLDLTRMVKKAPSSPSSRSTEQSVVTKLARPSLWVRLFSRHKSDATSSVAQKPSIVSQRQGAFHTPHLSLLPEEARIASQLPSEESWSVFAAFIIVGCFLIGLVYWGLTSIELNNLTTLDVLKPKVTTLTEYKKTLEPDRVKATALSRRLRIIEQLLDNHVYTSNVLLTLEQLTLPEVSYTSLTLDAHALTASLDAQTDSFAHVGEQLHVFEAASDTIKSVTISGGESSKDLATSQSKPHVAFHIDLGFFPTMLQIADPRKQTPSNNHSPSTAPSL